ncbi:hypothetical protein [Acanthopleuribacter pedis]|uniref:Phytanoyl-CoA dioxygenase n=1 Tax=Acanthopleuribacter pedis TaxID=442870 RepID=A0A8J7QC61_9BACT|nr:hypothetical protein [Acanthopleuribacter pedis]MBO1321414.1 hypothetical protein [Acanthopleuribacter pedis]
MKTVPRESDGLSGAALSGAALAAAVGEHARAILDPATMLGDVFQHCVAIHDHYAGITGLHARDAQQPEYMQETRLACGRAISLKHAAHCLLEFRRTAVYLRAVRDAVHAIHARRPQEPVALVYVGCGPYATLISPLLPLLREIPLQLTLIDIHQTALDMAGAVIEAMGFAKPELVRADAATYRHPTDRRMDVVVTETMRRALEGETQVAILTNFVGQMAADAVLIPESVTLEASLEWLRHHEHETPPEPSHQRLPWRLHVDRAFIAAIDPTACDNGAEITVQCDPIPLPVPSLVRHRLMIHTRITALGDHLLEDGNCSLNEVVYLTQRHFDTLSDSLACTYHVTGKTGLHIQGLKRGRV